ncbi:hypothetical protein KL86CLO1_11619 [uncultured Eubacteriales bacterium]|uniref:Uncharacterized protein n=1 Tax=uncultured Eubacteriales bacterium TaxID=172733 RepID=A0A212JS11_9FIRM|nr:hypothetical protein KL86CLO1_11619 [uncultured Eubacteriales bacterium]
MQTDSALTWMVRCATLRNKAFLNFKFSSLLLYSGLLTFGYTGIKFKKREVDAEWQSMCSSPTPSPSGTAVPPWWMAWT